MNSKKTIMVLIALLVIASSAFAAKQYVIGQSTTASNNPGAGDTPAAGAGGGGGGSGGGETTTETILETTLNNTITGEELAAILQEAGYSAEQVEAAKALLGQVEIEQTIKVEKTTGAGPTTYKSTVTITIKNPSDMDWKDVKVVIEIPKAIATNASEITSPLSFITLKADPILEFIVDIPTGTTKTITWSIAKEVTTNQSTKIKAPIIVGFQKETPQKDWCKINNVNCDDSNPCTGDSCNPETGTCTHSIVAENTVCGPNMVCKSGQCTIKPTGAVTTAGEFLPWWAILLIIIVIIGAAYYFLVMKKKGRKRK